MLSYGIVAMGGKFYLDIYTALGDCVDTVKFSSRLDCIKYLQANYPDIELHSKDM